MDEINNLIFLKIETPVGPMLSAASPKGVCFLEFADQEGIERQIKKLSLKFNLSFVPGNHHYLGELKNELNEYFSGKLQKFSVPLDYQGTSFQMSVYRQLQKIPYGQTRSYEDIARAIENLKAVRAVGHTNALNHIAILIPCHRVINKNGKPGGYAGGLNRKQFLLNLEHPKLV